jgi:hypothetical protein
MDVEDGHSPVLPRLMADIARREAASRGAPTTSLFGGVPEADAKAFGPAPVPPLCLDYTRRKLFWDTPCVPKFDR